MYGNSSLLYASGKQSDEWFDSSFALRRAATRRFWRLFAGSLWRTLRAFFGQSRAGLLSLKEVTRGKIFESSRQVGAVSVPVNQIVGSEGRSADFDQEFRPLKAFARDRWVSVAVALMQGKTLPPVELIKIGDHYFVRDGHHRISVAKAYGQVDIDAIVTVWNMAAAV